MRDGSCIRIKREFGKVIGTNPKLPPQLYAVVSACEPLGNREGRRIATIRKPGDLPSHEFSPDRAGRPEGKQSVGTVIPFFPVQPPQGISDSFSFMTP